MAKATVSLDSVVKHFGSLPDPRDTRNRRHLLVDVIAIAVCGVIVGCEGPTAIERWAKAKEDWVDRLLELPDGIPSRDCVRRVLSALKPEAFQECFQRWIAACLVKDADGDYVLAVKDNQPKLHEAIRKFFTGTLEDDLTAVSRRQLETHEKGHGRIDDRYYCLAKLPANFAFKKTVAERQGDRHGGPNCGNGRRNEK